MQDSRCQHVLNELSAALLALNADIVNPNLVAAILDDARTAIVDIVDAGISTGMSKRDASNLDAARLYINSAAALLAREWMWDKAEEAIRAAVEHVELAASNVIPLRRPRNTHGGGAA